MSDVVCLLTTGQPGAGKTYSRVKWLIEDFFVNNPTGYYITNLPLLVEDIAKYLSENCGKNYDDILSRFILISQEDYNFWKSIRTMTKDKREKYMTPDTYPPLVFFSMLESDGKLQNSHIALDEFHELYGKGYNETIRSLWGDWFSQIRKTGATFECITQDISKLAVEYIALAGIRTDLIPCSTLRDPIFKIFLYDWYQLRASYTGIIDTKVLQTEYLKTTSFTGRVKWKEQNFTKFTISPNYWRFYNSYKKTTGEESTKTPPYKVYGKQTWRWFLRRNYFPVLTRALTILFFMWLFFGGGIPMAFNYFMKFFTSGGGGLFTSKSSAKVQQMKTNAQSYASSPAGAFTQSNLSALKTMAAMYQPSEDIKQYKPALFFEGFCWLRNSIKIYQGYQFKGGYYDKKTVIKIDSSERFFELSDGVRLYMFE